MRIILYISVLFLIKSAFANEVTIIELHNKSIDQILIENSEKKNDIKVEQEILEENISVEQDSINKEEKLQILEEIDETLNTSNVTNVTEVSNY